MRVSPYPLVLRAYADWRGRIAEGGIDRACRWARDKCISINGMQTITSLRSQLLGELLKTGLVDKSDVGPDRRRLAGVAC